MARRSTRTIPGNLIPVDTEVDKVWGEPVVLKPMQDSPGRYREAVPDNTRVELITRGIYDQTRGVVEATGGGAIHTQATVDTTLSIRHEPVEQIALRKGDRVYFPERDETYEVTFVHPDPGGRPDVHLVKVIE